jgi:hypothetical protein
MKNKIERLYQVSCKNELGEEVYVSHPIPYRTAMSLSQIEATKGYKVRIDFVKEFDGHTNEAWTDKK